jgi:hypothetical protein
MSFIRAKEIPPRSGNWYDYEVETIHDGSRVIQKHIRYLGKSGSHSYLPTGNAASNSKMLISQNRNSSIEDNARIYKMKTQNR